MRSLSSNVQTIIAQDNISYFFLVTIGPFKNASDVTTTLRHTTIIGGITVSGDVYSDDNGLLHIDPPRMSSVVDKETYKISYADPSFYWRPIFEHGFSCVSVEIRVGFYNTMSYPMGTVSPGFPLNTYADTVIVYSGISDTPAYSIDLAGGEAIMTLECSSPMGALAVSRALYTTDDNLRQRFPNDNSFDQIFIGSKGVDVLWGKKV
jgi:hypothetical protein